MTKEQRRARREILQPSRKEKSVKIKRSRRCTCPDDCKKHGIFKPLGE